MAVAHAVLPLPKSKKVQRVCPHQKVQRDYLSHHVLSCQHLVSTNDDRRRAIDGEGQRAVGDDLNRKLSAVEPSCAQDTVPHAPAVPDSD